MTGNIRLKKYEEKNRQYMKAPNVMRKFDKEDKENKMMKTEQEKKTKMR